MERVLAIVIVALIFITLGVWEYASWSECLADHAWFYCLRTIN